MAPDEERLLQAVVDDPGDDAARQVYADWLEERGDRRAEYLRYATRLHPIITATAHKHRRHRGLLHRLDELAHALDAGWIDAVSRRYDVSLVGAQPRGWIDVISLVGELTGLGLERAIELVDAAATRPMVLLEGVRVVEATRARARFDAIGRLELIAIKAR